MLSLDVPDSTADPPVSLKAVLQTELDDARVDTGAADLPQVAAAYPGTGIRELRMVEGIVKLGPELDRMPFSYFCILDQRDIPVKLAGPQYDAYPGIAEAGAVAIDPAGWRFSECAC